MDEQESTAIANKIAEKLFLHMAGRTVIRLVQEPDGPSGPIELYPGWCRQAVVNVAKEILQQDHSEAAWVRTDDMGDC